MVGDDPHRHVVLVVVAVAFPGKLLDKADGLPLEVVAEREVAEHLEKGVVAGGVADVFQVVVLAAGAHALL